MSEILERDLLDVLERTSACLCNGCQYSKCHKMKGLLCHIRLCQVSLSGGCVFCTKMWCILKLHARDCKKTNCTVPRCKDIKEHLRSLQQNVSYGSRQLAHDNIWKHHSVLDISNLVNNRPTSDGAFGFRVETEETNVLYENGPVRALATGENGLLYAADRYDVHVWNKGCRDRHIDGPAYAMVLDLKGRLFLSDLYGRIKVWEILDPTSGNEVATLPLQEDDFYIPLSVYGLQGLRIPPRTISSLCLSDDQKYLYSGSFDNTVRTWRLEDLRLVDTIRGHSKRVNAVAAGFPNLVFSGSADGSIRMWSRVVHSDNGNIVTHKFERALNPYCEMSVNGLIFRSAQIGKGELIAALSDGAVRIYQETLDWGRADFLYQTGASISCIAVSGLFLFAGSVDGSIFIWRRVPHTGIHVFVKGLNAQQPVRCMITGKGRMMRRGRWCCTVAVNITRSKCGRLLILKCL